MSVFKHGKSGVYWYEFLYRGSRIRRSTRQRNKNVARDIEATHRTALLKGEIGIKDRQTSKIPTFEHFVPRFERTASWPALPGPGSRARRPQGETSRSGRGWGERRAAPDLCVRKGPL